jgi:ribosomal protein S27AE
VFDVPRVVDQRYQLQVYSQFQYRGAGAFGAAGFDLLLDLHSFEKIQEPRINTDSIRMSSDNPLALDVEKRTTRGRVCPRCGGKIIPSNRAVYQSGADPTGSFPIWQCERCGYEEMGERRKPAGKAKH